MTTAAARSDVIPYITSRRGEEIDVSAMLAIRPGGVGLCYRDEVPRDRDRQGVLWSRCTQRLNSEGRPEGSPRWASVHPSRQRETMAALHCQKCVQSASRTGLGFLFLQSPPAEGKARPGWPEGIRTTEPPLCLPHAQDAVEQCGRLLRDGWVALRARVPRLYGVIGTLFRCGPDGAPVPVEVPEEVASQPLSYRTDHLLRPWFLASQLVRELQDVTVIDLESEIALARLHHP
ncbi:hypothetical protein [Streptomyces lydicus]|uniref:hypothetical protein n=1 Tax=Streptomyces lydicus TaxID=47763 RepID=UPI0037B217E7